MLGDSSSSVTLDMGEVFQLTVSRELPWLGVMSGDSSGSVTLDSGVDPVYLGGPKHQVGLGEAPNNQSTLGNPIFLGDPNIE